MNDELIDFFQRSVAARSSMAQQLTPEIALACQALAKSLLGHGRIFVCGDAETVAIAQLMASQLITRYEFDRPSLPAHCLNDNALLESTLRRYLEPNQRYSHMLRSLGSPGDMLVLFTVGEILTSHTALIESAHEKGIPVIFCHTQNLDPDQLDLIQELDHDLLLPGPSKAIALDSLLFLSQTFNALIDHHLFGSEF